MRGRSNAGSENEAPAHHGPGQCQGRKEIHLVSLGVPLGLPEMSAQHPGLQEKICVPGYENAYHARRGRSTQLPFLKNKNKLKKPFALSFTSSLRRQVWNQSTCQARQAYSRSQKGRELPSRLALFGHQGKNNTTQHNTAQSRLQHGKRV